MQINRLSLTHNLSTIIKKEGPSALFKGVSSPLYNVPIIYSFYFGSFELGKWLMGVQPGTKTDWSHSVIAGAFSGLVSTIVLTPIELVKCKLQMEGVGEKIKRTGAYKMTKNILSKEGMRGLFKGGLVTTWREVVGNAVYFGVYEVLKNHLEAKHGEHIYTTITAGSIAGLLGWMSIYPQDIMKTRLQIHPEKYPIHPYFRDGGICAVTKEIYREDGLRGFSKGALPCAFKGIVAEAMTFLAYEQTKKWLLGTHTIDHN
jgi:solute carrier family 25 carnitine/acylcarnitine transporter 20/29